MGYSFDPAVIGWVLLGGLLVASGGLLVFVAFLWRLVGGHATWALSVAARREIDKKLGTRRLELVEEPRERVS